MCEDPAGEASEKTGLLPDANEMPSQLPRDGNAQDPSQGLRHPLLSH